MPRVSNPWSTHILIPNPLSPIHGLKSVAELRLSVKTDILKHNPYCRSMFFYRFQPVSFSMPRVSNPWSTHILIPNPLSPIHGLKSVAELRLSVKTDILKHNPYCRSMFFYRFQPVSFSMPRVSNPWSAHKLIFQSIYF